MMICAYKQGHGPAATELGSYAEIEQKFDAAVRYYQNGTKFGDESYAAALMLVFFREEDSPVLSKSEQETMKRMNLRPDPERSRRYEAIADALKINPDLRLTRLDLVVPLPPAKLPLWKGVQDARELENDALPTY